MDRRDQRFDQTPPIHRSSDPPFHSSTLNQVTNQNSSIRRPSLPVESAVRSPVSHLTHAPRFPSHVRTSGQPFSPRHDVRAGSICSDVGSQSLRFVPPPVSLLKGLESTTSSSRFHGAVMILIMLFSLASFICSVIQNACEGVLPCSLALGISFTIVKITCCVTFFVVYFLHLVGQCDYLSWSARRKVSMELMLTTALLIINGTVTIIVFFKTNAMENTAQFAIYLTVFEIMFMMIRITMLVREVSMLVSPPEVTGRNRNTDPDLRITHQPLEQVLEHSEMQTNTVVIQQPKRRSGRRRKRISFSKSISLTRTSIADRIDVESGIPCTPHSVSFARGSSMMSQDPDPRTRSQRDSDASAISSVTLLRNSSEMEDMRYKVPPGQMY